MNAKTSILAIVLLAAAGTAAAHPYVETRTPLVPGVDATAQGVGTVGVSFCEPVSPLATNCAAGGLGAFFVVTHLNSHSTSQVEGACTAQKVVSSLGDLHFVCGADRDDDGFVTDVDATNEDPAGGDHGTDGNNRDDQFYGALVPSGTFAGSVDVCFTHDADHFTALHDFDEIVVFTLGVLPTPYAGPTAVALSLTDRGNDC